MKKRLTSVALTIALLLSIGSYATAQDTTTTDTQVEASQYTGLNYYRDGDVPAQSAMEDTMLPPVTALVMSMVEKEMSYNSSDAQFCWNSLYYMLSLYGQLDSRAQLTDDTLILPTEAVQDYAAALFGDLNGLPQLPQSLEDSITVADGLYYLSRGDAGLSTIEIGSTLNLDDGTVLAMGQMVYDVDGTVLCTFTVKLQPNDTMFGYSICDAVVYS